MSRSRRQILAAALLLLSGSVASFTLTGCATRGYQKAAATSDAVSSAASLVDSARRQIDDATGALHSLINSPTAELRPAFERYRTAVATLDRTADQLRRQTDEMTQQGRNYFTAWDARLSEMRNEDIRARSAARQSEVTNQFTEIQQRYQDARREFEPLMSNLHDIRAALGIDLTPAGIQGTREFVTKTESSATATQQALSRLADGLRTLSTTLTPPPTAAAPAAGAGTTP
jgi:exonuclease VII large subunit